MSILDIVEHSLLENPELGHPGRVPHTRELAIQRRYIKGQKYTLLSRKENLTLDGKKALKTLLAANKRLNTAYVLKESFGQLWSYEREGWARRFFENWRASLKWQRLAPYEKFAAMIDRHWDGIAAYCRRENKVSLGFVEGLNNKIRVIQRRAYGLRNEDYLRLKILTCMLPALWPSRASPTSFAIGHLQASHLIRKSASQARSIAVDMPLRLDNASALPTCLQLHNSRNNKRQFIEIGR